MDSLHFILQFYDFLFVFYYTFSNEADGVGIIL